MSTVKSKKLQVGTDATATNNFTIYQPATPDGTLRIGVGNADSPTEVAQFNSTGIVGDGSQLTGLPAGYTDADALSLFNASGSTPVYACRAWVNFNGAGTVAISASGNVSSITDVATGKFIVNFTNAMPDANYSFISGGGSTSSGQTAVQIGNSTYLPSLTTTSCTVMTSNFASAFSDREIACVSFFR